MVCLLRFWEATHVTDTSEKRDNRRLVDECIVCCVCRRGWDDQPVEESASRDSREHATGPLLSNKIYMSQSNVRYDNCDDYLCTVMSNFGVVVGVQRAVRHGVSGWLNKAHIKVCLRKPSSRWGEECVGFLRPARVKTWGVFCCCFTYASVITFTALPDTEPR